MIDRLGVVGSRSIFDKDRVELAIRHNPFVPGSSPERWDLTIVSGGADGVDTSAEIFANSYGVDMNVVEPDWDDWSRGHPAKIRNIRIVEKGDAVVAVWDGHSNGTRDTIDKALDQGVPIYVDVID